MTTSANRLGRAPCVLSAALAVDAGAVTLTSLLARNLIRGPAVGVGKFAAFPAYLRAASGPRADEPGA